MLIDAFTYFNEEDLLEIRLSYLNDVVDKFILVEANRTQSLLTKPFYYEENKDRFAKYHDKIIHIKLEEHPDAGGWAMENFQRNAITKGLTRFRSDDLVMISDVDEIPDKEALKQETLMASINLHTLSFTHSFHAYYLNLVSPSKIWHGTVLTNVGDACRHSPQALRNNKDHMRHAKGGYHFSWLGGWEKVKQKFVSCIEPFDKNLDFKELEARFLTAATDGGFFLHSDNPLDVSIPLTKISLDTLPNIIKNNKEKYSHLLL